MSVDLYRRVTRKIPTRAYLPLIPMREFSADLADLSKEEGNNAGYILVLIDNFTRMIFAHPMKTKTAEEITEALHHIFITNGFVPQKLATDKESGIIHNEYLKAVGVNVYIPATGMAYLAEGAIKSIKHLLWPLRDTTPGRAWRAHLPEVVNELNHRPVPSLGVSPFELLGDDRKQREIMYKNRDQLAEERARAERQKTRGRVGDLVIMAKDRGPFHKGYKKQWDTAHVYRVTGVDRRHYPVMIDVVDTVHEWKKARAYPQHLQVITPEEAKKYVGKPERKSGNVVEVPQSSVISNMLKRRRRGE